MRLAENCQKPFPQPFVELQTFVFHNLAVQMRLKNAIGRGKDSRFFSHKAHLYMTHQAFTKHNLDWS